jgi:5-methylcytosine-specific restriction protein A
MSAYFFAWNTRGTFKWPNNSANSAASRRGEIVHIRWSTGGVGDIVPGDRIFLGKLGDDPVGVIASGVAASGCFQDTHWEDASRTTTYAMVDFDAILDPANVLPFSGSDSGPLGRVNGENEYGGVSIGEDAAEALEARWREWVGRAGFPQIDAQLERSLLIQAGYSSLIQLRLHWQLERDPKLLRAKRDAAKKSGHFACAVCERDFSEAAGKRGPGSSECHDTRAIWLLESTGDFAKNPDYIVLVCRSCHASLHQPDWPSIGALREELRSCSTEVLVRKGPYGVTGM